jgi:hypothetical protein
MQLFYFTNVSQKLAVSIFRVKWLMEVPIVAFNSMYYSEMKHSLANLQ